MSFHLTAEGIEVRDNHILFARLQNESGDLQESEIDLNQYLGNNNGHFEWDGENFSETTQNVQFAIEGGGAVPVLRGELTNLDGELVPADVNLSERIINENGRFVFSKCEFIQL